MKKIIDKDGVCIGGVYQPNVKGEIAKTEEEILEEELTHPK